MRDLERLARVLLDHQDGDAHAVDLAHEGEDVAHHEGREAERRLVHQQQPRRRDERARDRHHLLLAAAERACDLVAGAPAGAGSARTSPRCGARRSALSAFCKAAEPQVVHDRERVPELPAFGHPGHPSRWIWCGFSAQQVGLRRRRRICPRLAVAVGRGAS